MKKCIYYLNITFSLKNNNNNFKKKSENKNNDLFNSVGPS